MIRAISRIALFSACLLLFVSFSTAFFGFDTEEHLQKRTTSSTTPESTWWYALIDHQGEPAYGDNSSYVVWRNVLDYGAVGDGVTDDTNAINNATAAGNRCSYYDDCGSSTTTPAIVYFPPGTYLVSAPLVMLYYTQFIGDLSSIPTIKASPDFYGIGVLDSDPYLEYGVSWYTNQNNFWRQVRNFIIDMTDLDYTNTAAGIHWQVAQGTSLQNIVFNMAPGTNSAGTNSQMGIFQDNGSGGWMEDLVFNGGGICYLAGNQQWTSRNMTFNGCQTAIYQNWAWIFTYKSLSINDCVVGIDLTQGDGTIVAQSMVVQDSVFTGVTQAAILTSFSYNSTPAAGGALTVDNCQFISTPAAVAYSNGTVIVPGNQTVDLFIQGDAYTVVDTGTKEDNQTCYQPAATMKRIQQIADPVPKAVALLDATGKFYERSKTQYPDMPVESVVSIIDFGCSNDGYTDVTECVQEFFDSITTDQLAFIDQGAYVISDTITIPNNINIVGEIWPLFMVDGSSEVFSDTSNPTPAFRVGLPGDTGAVEMQEIIFETLGPAPGAIMMEYNLANEDGVQGSNTLWDVHWRIGGTNGTLLNPVPCAYDPDVEVDTPNPDCYGAFLLLHITSTAELLMSNNWGWIADHQLDGNDTSDLDLYSGRGVLIESQGPVWMYGTAFEHSQLFNYELVGAEQIYLGIIQSETAYMQSNPISTAAFTPNATWNDPTFDNCYATTCYKTWGLRMLQCNYVYVYGTGLYSFFDNYDSGCLIDTICQENMISIEQSEGIYMFSVNTIGSSNMVLVDDYAIATDTLNADTLLDTVGLFEYP